MKERKQIPLFEEGTNDEAWQEEWQDMPEFVQKDITSFQSIVVHFANKEDRDKYAALIGQKLTYLTRSIWFPPAEIGRYANKRYIDEETLPTVDEETPLTEEEKKLLDEDPELPF